MFVYMSFVFIDVLHPCLNYNIFAILCENKFRIRNREEEEGGGDKTNIAFWCCLGVYPRFRTCITL